MLNRLLNRLLIGLLNCLSSKHLVHHLGHCLFMLRLMQVCMTEFLVLWVTFTDRLKRRQWAAARGTCGKHGVGEILEQVTKHGIQPLGKPREEGSVLVESVKELVDAHVVQVDLRVQCIL